MAKRQKSFFERLAEKNSNHDSKKQISTSQKRRNKGTIAALAVLGVGVVTAIVVPLAVNVTSVTYNQALAGNTSVATFNGNKTANLTVDQIMALLNDKKVTTAEELENLYKQAIYYWYEKEAAASVQYQELYNASLPSGKSANTGIALKSISEIRNTKQKIISDLISNFKKVYGYENWNSQFIKTIQTDNYGKSNTETEAVEYLTFKEIEDIAKNSFKVAVTTLDKSEVQRIANKTVYAKDASGNQIKDANGQAKVLVQKGDNPFPWLKENTNYFVGENGKVTTFLTKSFIESRTSADAYLEEFLNNNTLVINTEVLLPGVYNANLELPWTFSDEAKTQLINLNKVAIIDSSDNANGFEIVNNLDVLKGFKKAEQYLANSSEAGKKAKTQYETFLKALTLSSNNNLGTNGIQSYSSIISSDVKTALAMISDQVFEKDTNKVPSVSLANLYKLPTVNEEINQKIAKLIEEAKTITDKNQAASKIELINREIESYIKNLSAAQWNEYILSTFNKTFNIEWNAQNFQSFVYRVDEFADAKLVLTDKGIKLVRTTTIDSLDNLKYYVHEDLKNIANGNKSYFDIVSKLTSTQNKNQIIAATLKEADFIERLKKEKNPYSSTSNANYTQDDIAELQNKNNSILLVDKNKNFINSLVETSKFISTSLANQSNYNFVVKDGIIKIAYNLSDSNYSELSAIDTISSVIKSKMKVGN